MKLKTSELEGTALDWAVAKCEGLTIKIPAWAEKPWLLIIDDQGREHTFHSYLEWSQGGPIIERENISFRQYVKDGVKGKWYAKICKESGTQIHWKGWGAQPQTGPTPLIAAMRCLVSSKLGDEVEIPNEIKEPS